MLLVRCFKFQSTFKPPSQHPKVNWMGAYVDCIRENMNLASIESSEENAEVADLFQNHHTSSDPHIGGTSQHDGREFVWISNGKTFEYTNWAANEPDCWPRGCMVFYRYETTWATDRCRYLRPFVCEYYEDY